MPKIIRGSAGRIRKRGEQLEEYGTSIAGMLLKQVKVDPNARMMHLGAPGAIEFAQNVAPFLATGELVVVVFTYDELEETQAALAGIGNVQVINEIDDLDPDEPPYDIITCSVPYNRRRDYIEELLKTGVRLLNAGGTLYLAGDRQQGFEREVALIRATGSEVTPLAQDGHLRVVAVSKNALGGQLRMR